MYEPLKSTITFLQAIIKTSVSDFSDWSKTSLLSHWFLREESLIGDVKPSESPDFKQKKKLAPPKQSPIMSFTEKASGGQGEKGKWG